MSNEKQKKTFSLFGKNKNRESTPKQAGKNQPNLWEKRPGIRDIVKPAAINTVVPGDLTSIGKATDYHVEVGATIEPVRYYRSFFANLSVTSTMIGMFDSLFEGDFGEADCDVVLKVKPADPDRALYDLTRAIAGLESDYQMEKDPNKRAFIWKSLEDYREQMARLRLGVEKLFFTSLQAIVSDTNYEGFKKYCNLLVKRYKGKGIYLRAADNRQREALLRMTPLDYDEEMFKDTYRGVESSNLADFFFLGKGTIQHKSGIIAGETPEGKVIMLNPWDPSLENAHIIVLGRSGSGKSYLVKGLISRATLNGIKIAGLDNGIEYKLAVEDRGGVYISLGGDSPYRLNIFDVEDEMDINGRRFINLEQSINFAQVAIRKMIETIDPTILTGRVKLAIQEHIRKLYDKIGITEDYRSLYEPDPDGLSLDGMRKKRIFTLSDFYDAIKDDEELIEAANCLKTFTRYGGVKSRSIFDGETNINFKDEQLFFISLYGLDEEIMKPIGQTIATKWLDEYFVKKQVTVPKLLVLDEFQNLLRETETAKWAEKRFREGRKDYLGVVALTQGFQTFINTPEGLACLQNAETKFILKQDKIDIDVVTDKMDLTEFEARVLVKPPEKGYFILKSGGQSSRGKLVASPEEDKLYSTDPKELALRQRAAVLKAGEGDGS